jgi:hypothetical protein
VVNGFAFTTNNKGPTMLTSKEILRLHDLGLLQDLSGANQRNNSNAIRRLHEVIPLEHLNEMCDRLQDNGVMISANQLRATMQLFPIQRMALIDDTGTDAAEAVMEALCLAYLHCAMVQRSDNVDYDLFIHVLNTSIRNYPF